MANQISGNKKNRINALDFLLIILIIVVIAVTVVTVIKNNPANNSSGDTNISYVISSQLMNSAVASQIKAGDTLYDSASSQPLGTITEVELIPVKALTENNSSLTEIELTNKVDVKITVSAAVNASKTSYNIGNYRIAVNQAISVHSNYYSVNGTCISITVQE